MFIRPISRFNIPSDLFCFNVYKINFSKFLLSKHIFNFVRNKLYPKNCIYKVVNIYSSYVHNFIKITNTVIDDSVSS